MDDIVAVLPPLLQSLEALGFIARHLNPPDFGRVMHAAGAPDMRLAVGPFAAGDWPAEFDDVRTSMETASDAALAAFDGLRAVQDGDGDLRGVSRAASCRARAGGAVSARRKILPLFWVETTSKRNEFEVFGHGVLRTVCCRFCTLIHPKP